MTIATAATSAAAEKKTRGKPAGPADVAAASAANAAANVDMTIRPGDGACLPLAALKLAGKLEAAPIERPFTIWALGSSYTNKLGDGAELISLIQQRFPQANIVYKKHVGNAVPYEFLTGWVRHLAAPDNPDLLLIYALGDADGLDMVLTEARRRCTADIIVPSLHLRRADLDDQGQPLAGAVDSEQWKANEAVARKYGAEWVDNRKEWAAYMKNNGVSGLDLLADGVHQSELGANLILHHIARHIALDAAPAYDIHTRERRLQAEVSDPQWGDTVAAQGPWTAQESGAARCIAATDKNARLTIRFAGDRIHLIGVRQPGGGKARVLIDGQPGSECPAFQASFIEADGKNSQSSTTTRNDAGPHGVELLANVVPQTWTLTMLDGARYALSGSVTGPDGEGDTGRDFVSRSGQIRVPTALWRPTQSDKRVRAAGDKYRFEVARTAIGEVAFGGEGPALFRVMLADNLANGPHTVELVAQGDGPIAVDAFEVFQPPMQ